MKTDNTQRYYQAISLVCKSRSTTASNNRLPRLVVFKKIVQLSKSLFQNFKSISIKTYAKFL